LPGDMHYHNEARIRVQGIFAPLLSGTADVRRRRLADGRDFD